MILRRITPAFLAAVAITFFGCNETTSDFSADFEASMTDIGAGQSVNFEDNSIGGVTAWSWTFEGGEPATSTDKEPFGILYQTPGTYDVSLTVTTDEGTHTESKEDYIVVTQLAGGCDQLTTVTDIDGNVYSVVTIGSQCWMGENLKTEHYKDGSAIPQVTDETEWKNLLTGAFCWYDNDNSHDATYGKLYNWHAIDDSRGICPEGWHVPHDNEMQVLTRFLGSADDVAGGRMKEAGTDHWQEPNTGGSNTSGFTGLPGGMRFQEGQFDHMGTNGLFWSSRRESESLAFYVNLTYNSEVAHRTYIYKRSGFSCRCVKD